MTKRGSILSVLYLAITSGSCLAYETETHALITRQAYEKSSLSQQGKGSIVSTLGLDRLNLSSPFDPYWVPQDPEVYYTNGGTSGVTPALLGLSLVTGIDYPEAFERCEMQEFLQISDGSRSQFKDLFEGTVSSGTGPAATDSVLPIANWLVRGAIREDDLGDGLGLLSLAEANCGFFWLLTVPNQPSGVVRSYNHFYDPYLDIGLTTATVNGKRSTNWALGYVNSISNPPIVDAGRGNTYSYIDARNAFYWAITREYNKQAGQPYTAVQHQADAFDRMFLWATAFRSLGDVVHLLEDTGQPQHTRNDPHSAVNSDQRQAFEGYTNARVLGQGGVGRYVQAFFPGSTVPLSVPDLGNYPGPTVSGVTFASPVRFFTTRGDLSDTGDPTTRLGLADYTNRGFFTGGTLPGMVPEIYPPSMSSENSDYVGEPVPCVLLAPQMQLQAVDCVHYTHAVPDKISPNYADQLPFGFSVPNVPIISEGVFNQIILSFNGLTVDHDAVKLALSPTELDAIGNMTIPRAVGYATGMINFFFRGVGGIAITPPSSGVYAIVDHGQTHIMNAQGYPCVGSTASDGCPIFGFDLVQANIQNKMSPLVVSGSGNPVAQNMTNGTLVAVARWHRDQCYTPDLSGEPSYDMNSVQQLGGQAPPIYSPICPNEMAFSLARSPYPEISVSAPIAVDANGAMTADSIALGNINSTSPTTVNFDFTTDPIPINATDLFLEAVFQGTLGDTTSSDANKYEINSVVTGSIDVSEPTYNVFMNLTNYYYDTVGKSWMTVAQAQAEHFPVYDPSEETIPRIMNCAGTDELVHYGYQGVSPGLAVGHAIRVAMILDPVAAANGEMLQTAWAAPEAGYYNGSVYVSSGGAISGMYGAIANMLTTNPQPPYYTTHSSQASLESNANADFAATGFNSGVGATWGDNIYWTYQAGIATTSYVPIPIVPPVPQNPSLVGSAGAFLSDPIPSGEIYLNVGIGQTCLSVTP
jgi:hypothetical protein